MENNNKVSLKERMDMEISKNVKEGMNYTPIRPYLESDSLLGGISKVEIGEDQCTFVVAGNEDGFKGLVCRTGLRDIAGRILRDTLGEPESVTSNEEGVEFVFNGYIFQDMGVSGLSLITARPVGRLTIPFAEFAPYTLSSEEYASLRERIKEPVEKQGPDPRVLDKCRSMLQAWADVRGISSNSENWIHYATKGREDIRKALAALERGDYQHAQPIAANLWDAGYDWDHRCGGYSLSDLRLIGSALAGTMKPEEFFEKLGEE